MEQKIRGGDLELGLESHLAKSRSLLPKLALIFHLAENSREEEIPQVEAQRAAKFCAYLESHARRAYGCVASGPLQLAAVLGQKLRLGKVGNRFRVGDIYLQGWAGLDTAERAGVAIRVLVDAGWVRPSGIGVGSSGSAPGDQYTVNPAIYRDSTIKANIASIEGLAVCCSPGASHQSSSPVHQLIGAGNAALMANQCVFPDVTSAEFRTRHRKPAHHNAFAAENGLAYAAKQSDACPDHQVVQEITMKNTTTDENQAATTTPATESTSPPPRLKKKAKTSSRRAKPVAKRGSKKAAVLAMLRKPKGATLAEIMQRTGWQAHSVRGFLSGSLRKEMHLKIESTKRPDGRREYHLNA